MVILSPTEKQIKLAKEFAEKNKNGYNKRSYRNGDLILESRLSEIVVGEYFGFEVIDDYDYDFVSMNGKKIDLKTKPRSDVEPRVNWNACVPAYQIKFQNCDYYLFNRINRALDKIWVLGYISKKEFKKKAVFVKKGELDPDSAPRNPWVCPEDAFYIKLSELKKV